MKDFENLVVWKNSMKLTKDIYLLVKEFPKEEKYGLISQMTRAATSIPSNIAEGCGKNTQKEFLHFLHNAFGSLKELECQLILSKDLEFTPQSKYIEIRNSIIILSKMMSALIIKTRKEI